jgi:hypothetical protein
VALLGIRRPSHRWELKRLPFARKGNLVLRVLREGGWHLIPSGRFLGSLSYLEANIEKSEAADATAWLMSGCTMSAT